MHAENCTKKCSTIKSHDEWTARRMNLECGDRHIQEYFKVEPEFDFLKSRKLLFSGSDTNYIDVQNDDWGSSQAEGKSLNIIQIFESIHMGTFWKDSSEKFHWIWRDFQIFTGISRIFHFDFQLEIAILDKINLFFHQNQSARFKIPKIIFRVDLVIFKIQPFRGWKSKMKNCRNSF